MESSKVNGSQHSPVQIVQDQLGAKFLFYISSESGDLLCSKIEYESSSLSSSWLGTKGLMRIYKGPIRGFSVLLENSGRMSCYIQKPDDKIVLVHSQDSGMSWQELGEFS